MWASGLSSLRREGMGSTPWPTSLAYWVGQRGTTVCHPLPLAGCAHGSRFLLRIDHASLTWLMNFKNPEGQVARWLEALQEYDFEIQHRAGRHHGNADALSRRPCATDGWNCPLDHQTTDATAGDTCDPGTGERLVGDRAAPQVPRGVGTGARGEAYHSQWGNLEIRNGVMYWRWQAPWRGNDFLQLLVPQGLRPQVLQVVHGSVGVVHYRLSTASRGSSIGWVVDGMWNCMCTAATSALLRKDHPSALSPCSSSTWWEPHWSE